MISYLPKLRRVNANPVIQNGRPYILLQDPLKLSENSIILPQNVVPLLSLCDGTRDAQSLSAALAIRHGQMIPSTEIERLLNALDEAFLLENERFMKAMGQALYEYRQAPFRKAILAGVSYPSEKDALRDLLQSHLAGSAEHVETTDILGLVSPHIDFQRGGQVYAAIWSRVTQALQEVDLAIIFGTDHFGEGAPLSLTRQHYATPYGILPTAQDLVNTLTKAIGEESAFAGELYHQSEHSIELAAVWLHHMRQGEPCELLPILCGSFERFFTSDSQPEEDPLITKFLAALQEITANRRVIVVAAADLSHVGPVFGGHPIDLLGRARLEAVDQELINRICGSDPQGFFEAIRQVEDRNNVCGLAPIYLTLRLLSPIQGELVAYDRCPADSQGTSLVSVCGIVLREPNSD